MSNSDYGINDMLNKNSGNTNSSGSNTNNQNSNNNNPANQYGINSGSSNNSSNNPTNPNSYDQAMEDAVKAKAGRNMLFGGLWLFGGVLATMSDIGAVFWGAIVFGAIQFIGGLINYFK